MSEIDERLQALAARVDHFAELVSAEEKTARIAELEAAMSEAGFWDDQEAAQVVIGELKRLKNIVEPWRELAESVTACRELAEMAVGDEESEAEVVDEAGRLEAAYEALELKLALSGEYDECDVYLSIQPGAGGTDARDFGEMLFRMYTAYAERAGYRLEVVDMKPGEDAGIQGCTLSIKGENAYGYLKSEMGTHRLVRISPFNSGGTRETSFCAVEVTPELPESKAVALDDIDEKELRIDTYRASGAGGQHVNKTDSAVRITHLPTGTVTSCQSERSQTQNKAKAMKMMAAKLQQLQDADRLDELKALQGERGTIGWGHQIRSYVLHPYQMCKDLRTGHEVGNIQSVLDGDLQGYIDAYLRWRLQQSA